MLVALVHFDQAFIRLKNRKYSFKQKTANLNELYIQYNTVTLNLK
jgi:hypothetical protein